MTTFVMQQIDYLLFVYGLSFLLLFAICCYFVRFQKSVAPWQWLGAFGLTHGIYEWLELGALTIIDVPVFECIRWILWIISYCCLCEFGRRTTSFGSARGKYLWLTGLLLVGTLLGGLGGFSGLKIMGRYTLGFCGSLWAAIAMFRIAKMPNQFGVSWLKSAGVLFVAYGIVDGLVVPAAPFFPASFLNQDDFLRDIGLPVQLFRGVIAIGLTMVLWHYLIVWRQTFSEALACAPSPYISRVVNAIIAVTALGWVGTELASHLGAYEFQTTIVNHMIKAVPEKVLYHALDSSIAQHRLTAICLTGFAVFVLIGSLHNVQRNRNFHEQTNASEQLYRSIFNNSPNRIQLFDAYGRCLAINDRGLAKMDMIPSGVVGWYYFEEWPPEVAPDAAEAFAQTIRGEISEFEAKYIRPDGQFVIWHVTLSPVPNSKGETHRVVEIAVDVTERYKNEMELRRAKEAAEAANVAKSHFVANMSHEIRTPITAVLGYADLLLDPQLGEEDRIGHLHTIRRNGEILLNLVNDILDLSKMDADKLQIERLRCSPWRLLHDVRLLLWVQAMSKKLSLTIENDGPIPETILTDPARLGQILTNLVGNAIKFTQVGHVRMVMRLVSPEGREPLLQIDVIDTGIGMTPSHLQTIFTPFTQADSSTSRKYGGTGLGLTISKRLANMLGGDITVTSQFGKGSAFRLTIAVGALEGITLLEQPPELSLHSRRETPVTEKLSCHVLVVEDGFDNQRLLSLVLQKAGAKVTIASNGKEALDKVLPELINASPKKPVKQTFDLILMDLQMPVMDGLEATCRLRQGGFNGPIIALSAHTMADAVKQCMDAGCNGYLTKPIDREMLLQNIAYYTGNQKRTDDVEPVLDALDELFQEDDELIVSCKTI